MNELDKAITKKHVLHKNKKLLATLFIFLIVLVAFCIYSQFSANGPVSFNLKTCSKDGEEIHTIISLDPDIFDAKKCCPGLWPYHYLSGVIECKPPFYQYPYKPGLVY